MEAIAAHYEAQLLIDQVRYARFLVNYFECTGFTFTLVHVPGGPGNVLLADHEKAEISCHFPKVISLK